MVALFRRLIQKTNVCKPDYYIILHTFLSFCVLEGIALTFWSTKTTMIWIWMYALGDFNRFLVFLITVCFAFALSTFLPLSLIYRVCQLLSHFIINLVSLFPDQQFPPSLPSYLHLQFCSPYPPLPFSPDLNPMKRCISYYQSLMNLDLKMEYCPETNLS